MSNLKRSHSRRDFLRMTAMTVGGAALAACAPKAAPAPTIAPSSDQPTAEPAKPENTEIVFVTPAGATDMNEEIMKNVYDKFRQTNSNITIKWLGVQTGGNSGDYWGTYFDKLAITIAGGSQVDFAKIPTEGGRLAAARGLVVPIDQYIEATPTMKDYFSDVSPKLASIFKYGGKTYELPYAFESMFVFINTKRLKEVGLEMPKEDWSFNEFLDYAKALTVRDGGNVKNWGFQFWLGPFGTCPWLMNNGLDGILGGPLQDKALANDPKSLEVIEFLHSLIYEHKVAPRLDAELPAKIQDGSIAMNVSGHWPVDGYVKDGFMDFEIAYWPKGTTRVTEVGVGGFAIFSSAKNKDAVWTWESFILSKENLKDYVYRTNVPAHRSLGTDPEYVKIPKETGKRFYEAIDRDDMPVIAVTAPPDFGEMDSIYNRAMTTVFSDPDKSKIKGVMDQCQKELEAMIAKRPAEWATQLS